MKSEIINPNILQIKLQFEREEDMYTRCMWARINLDNDNYSLTAETDCGSYSYYWRPTDRESFLELMCRINKDYLLGKIANENVFDCNETTKNISNHWEEHAKQIKQIGASSMQEYIEQLDDIDEVDIFDGLDIYEYACYRYPYGAITFCEIFEKYVQPLIREHLENRRMKKGKSIYIKNNELEMLQMNNVNLEQAQIDIETLMQSKETELYRISDKNKIDLNTVYLMFTQEVKDLESRLRRAYEAQ